jgi:hypothetical protein
MTPTQFSNLALSQLPSVGIVNLDEASLPARTCKLWYQQTVDELLEMGPWRFQIEREVLAELPGNDREAQWLYAFAPPSGAAYIIQVMDETGLGSQAYEYSGDIIYTNVPNVTAEFVSNDPGTLATLARARFRGALIAMLAARTSRTSCAAGWGWVRSINASLKVPRRCTRTSIRSAHSRES